MKRKINTPCTPSTRFRYKSVLYTTDGTTMLKRSLDDMNDCWREPVRDPKRVCVSEPDGVLGTKRIREMFHELSLVSHKRARYTNPLDDLHRGMVDMTEPAILHQPPVEMHQYLKHEPNNDYVRAAYYRKLLLGVLNRVERDQHKIKGLQQTIRSQQELQDTITRQDAKIATLMTQNHQLKFLVATNDKPYS